LKGGEKEKEGTRGEKRRGEERGSNRGIEQKR
jgi:hypothetical protein